MINAKYLSDKVEVNLAINDIHMLDDGSAMKYDVADLVSKLSIHIRSGVDVKVVLPVSKDYYCDQDDMYIFNHHGGDLFWNGGELAENISTVTIKFGKSGNNVVTPPTEGETPDPEVPEDPECEGDGDCCGGNNEGECQEPEEGCGEGGCCCSPEESTEPSGHSTCENCPEAGITNPSQGNITSCFCENMQDWMEDCMNGTVPSEDAGKKDKMYCKCNKVGVGDPEQPEGPSMAMSRADAEDFEITVHIDFNSDNITVWTEGVTEDAINWLKENYADGLNIEIYNYYNRANQDSEGSYAEWTLTELKNALDESTIEFVQTDKTPDMYVNAFTGTETSYTVDGSTETVYRDCYVTPLYKDTYFHAPYFDYHFNGYDENLIYVNKNKECDQAPLSESELNKYKAE